MTYSDWRVELSEKYKVFKGLYKIIKTPGVIKAAPKQKLKNTVGISYKNSMGTLDYRRSIFPDYKANRRNRFARIKATPSGDPMADLSQNIYKKEGKRSLERRLAAKEKLRQEWLKANNLPPDSSAQPPHFNEGVASLALKGSSKFIPALMTGIGAAGTIMQSKKRSPKGPFADTPSAEELRKAKLTGKITIKPKKGEKKDAIKTVKDFLKARKIEGRTAMRLKQDDELVTKGPGDQLPGARRDYLKNLLKNLRKEEVAIVNNVGDGKIAGTVEAGDDPPVKKKKKKGKKKKTYAYGGRGSRKMWMT